MNKSPNHPPLPADKLKECKKYTHYTEGGEIDEQWERNENGNWKNLTERVKLQQEIIKAERELAKLHKKEKRNDQLNRK